MWFSSKFAKMINIAGIVSIVIFYILILAVGLWAARKKQAGDDSEEEVMLAGRSIGLFVGIFTMTGEYQGNASLIKLPISRFYSGSQNDGKLLIVTNCEQVNIRKGSIIVYTSGI
jgi:Na+/pantothenate symporter